jgi:hypothetical protein
MSLVLEALRKNTSTYNKQTDDDLPLLAARTDFTIYDYMNGECSEISGPNDIMQKYVNSGMFPGIHSAIGRTQSGKTSFFTKLCANVVRNYPNSVFYFRDAEKTTTVERTKQLTGFTQQEYDEKVDYKRYHIDHDFVYNDIRRICQMKENLRDSIMIDTGFVDSRNQRIRVFPPDVYLVDSLPSLLTADEDEEVKTGPRNKNVVDVKDAVVNKRIEGMQEAGANKMLLTKILDMVYMYNLRVILVNHITSNTQLGQNPRYIQKQLTYLRQNEKLPGGSNYLHNCTTIVRTDFVHRLDDDEFGPMIHGSRNRLTMVKSKSNVSGIPVEIIFDQQTGYNGLLSSFNYILNRRYGLDMAARSMSLKVMPSISFTKKTIWESLLKDARENGYNAQFIKALLYTARRCLFFDFCLKRPDPNPINWTTGVPTSISFSEGIMS